MEGHLSLASKVVQRLPTWHNDPAWSASMPDVIDLCWEACTKGLCGPRHTRLMLTPIVLFGKEMCAIKGR